MGCRAVCRGADGPWGPMRRGPGVRGDLGSSCTDASESSGRRCPGPFEEAETHSGIAPKAAQGTVTGASVRLGVGRAGVTFLW